VNDRTYRPEKKLLPVVVQPFDESYEFTPLDPSITIRELEDKLYRKVDKIRTPSGMGKIRATTKSQVRAWEGRVG